MCVAWLTHEFNPDVIIALCYVSVTDIVVASWFVDSSTQEVEESTK